MDIQKYVNAKTIIKNELYDSFKVNLICPKCKYLMIQPVMCIICQSTFCKKCLEKCKDDKGLCQKKCKKSNYKDLIGKNIHITKFKFKCINGCGEEIPFSDIQKHYNKKCKNIKKPKKLEKPIVQDNEHKQLNILSPQQVAKLKKNSSDKIPYITSKKKLYLNIFIFNSLVITLGEHSIGKSSLIDA